MDKNGAFLSLTLCIQKVLRKCWFHRTHTLEMLLCAECQRQCGSYHFYSSLQSTNKLSICGRRQGVGLIAPMEICGNCGGCQEVLGTIQSPSLWSLGQEGRQMANFQWVGKLGVIPGQIPNLLLNVPWAICHNWIWLHQIPHLNLVFDVSVGDLKIQNLERFWIWLLLLGKIWVLAERARNQPFCLRMVIIYCSGPQHFWHRKPVLL